MLRVVTYNVHKCAGLDRRTSPQRIADVLRELDADIIALQEILSIPDQAPEDDQIRFIARTFPEYHWRFGENRRLRGGAYGNAVISRFPVRFATNYDLTWRGRERRGCLRTDLEVGGLLLHLFNVHLGTSFFERRHQGRKLVSHEVLHRSELRGPRIVLGDFNEWTRGLASRLMAGHFRAVHPKLFARYGRTYPGVFPVLHLDHVYYDRGLELLDCRLHRTRRALVASDHLPILAEFKIIA